MSLLFAPHYRVVFCQCCCYTCLGDFYVEESHRGCVAAEGEGQGGSVSRVGADAHED